MCKVFYKASLILVDNYEELKTQN